MKIIVVDDHPVVRNELCGLLSKQLDMDVVANVADAQAALLLLKDGLKVNIVLTDLNMPGMDGLELTRQVIAMEQNMRVVILTLNPQLGIKQRALAAGAKDCLSKEDDLDGLLASLRAAHAYEPVE